MMASSGIRYFLAVAKAGSFRRAEDVLHVSASAINRQISLIESDYGMPLFERSRGRNRLRLTSAGEILLHHAKEVTGALERARSEIEALKGLRTGVVTVGVPESSVNDFFVEFLSQFSKSYSGISFKVNVGTPNDLTEQLLRDDLDLALIYHPSTRAAIKVVAKVERPNCVMVRRDHPLARRSSIQLAECASYPLVMPEIGTRARDLYDEMLVKASVKPHWIVTTTSYEMLCRAARAGLGVAIVSDYVANSRASPEVALVPLRDCPPAILTCCIRTGRRLSVIADVFLARICDHFTELEQSKKPVGGKRAEAAKRSVTNASPKRLSS